MVYLDTRGGVRSSPVVRLSWRVWSLVTASAGQAEPWSSLLLRGARGRRGADSCGQALSAASGAWRVPAVLTARGEAGGSGWWGMASHTQTPSTAPPGIASRRARNCRAALREPPRGSRQGCGPFSRSPRCLEGQGDSQEGPQGGLAGPGHRGRAVGAGRSKDGPLAGLKMRAPRRPRRPRVGATGHLRDEGCASRPRARVLVTGDSREGPQSLCVHSQEAQACACTPVWACALPGRTPADAGWRGRCTLKVRGAVPAPRGLTAL